MGANRTRIRELADSQPILLIRTDSQFARADLRVGESKNGKKLPQFYLEFFLKNKQKNLEFFFGQFFFLIFLRLDKNDKKILFFWPQLAN